MYVKVDVCKMVVGTCESCFVCDDGGGRRREAGGPRDTESKARTPHKVVGKNTMIRGNRTNTTRKSVAVLARHFPSQSP